MKANMELRDYIHNQNVFMWEVANAMGISESAFMKMMRFELIDSKKTDVKDAVKKIVSTRNVV